MVTGASHGLGMAMAIGLANAGAKVIINGRSTDRLLEAAKQFKKHNINVAIYSFDVTKENEVRTMIDTIEDEEGPIDILVNNAGIIKRIPFLEMEASDFREVVDTDLVGPFIMSKIVGNKMAKRKGGKIINICSMMSELGRNTVSAYAAAKGGLKMLTRNMATELAKYNIQVNGIGPGYFATIQTEPIRVDGHPFNDLVMTRTPAGRWGDPEDLGGTAVFLASKASDYINGQVIYVDGGIVANFGYVKGENDLED